MRKNNDIDLIIPEGAFLKNRARAIKKEQKMKQKKLFVELTAAAVVIIMMVLLISACMNLKQKGIQGCLENGYSYGYCLEHS